MRTARRMLPLVLAMLGLSVVPSCKSKDKEKAKDDPKGGKTDPKGGGKTDPKSAGPTFTAIQAAALSTCGVTESGTVRCWGANLEGQLGVGKEADALLENYTPMDVAGVSGVKTLWADASYSWSGSHSEGYTDTACAQAADGSVKCWGHNGGIFGDGEYQNQVAPVAAPALASVKQFVAASGHACAVWPDKTAKCWGSNAFGVAGVGNEESEIKVPTPVKDFTDVAAVGCGQNHCCGMKNDGTAWCWGLDGLLGNGAGAKSNVPVQVTGVTDATQLAVGTSNSCVLKKDRTVMCWGRDFGDAAMAVEGATDITQLDAQGIACGLKADKSVVCWGNNYYGELGDGTKEERPTKAAPVKGLAGVTQISVGTHHGCALLEDKHVKCWGKNGRGQLGDGTITDRLEPVAMVETASERPNALPTDGKVAAQSGMPDACAKTITLEAKVSGKPIAFTVRNIESKWSWSELGYEVNFYNYDKDEKNPWSMPRGQQARISFGLEKWVIEKGADDKETLTQKPADMEQPYTNDYTSSYRTTNSAGIFDNHKQRFFDAGQIKLTHLDDKWICGDIDLSHSSEGHAVKGSFAVPVPPKKT